MNVLSEELIRPKQIAFALGYWELVCRPLECPACQEYLCLEALNTQTVNNVFSDGDFGIFHISLTSGITEN